MSCPQPSILRQCVDPRQRSDLALEEILLLSSSGHVISQGFHVRATVRTSLRRRGRQRCIFSDKRKYDVLMVYHLPRNCYVDPSELQDYNLNFQVNGIQQPSSSLQINIHTYKAAIDTESIAEVADGTLYVIEVLGIDMTSTESDCSTLNISHSIPLHVRYHRSKANGSVVSFRVEPPVLLSRATLDATMSVRDREGRSQQVLLNRVYDETHLGNLGNANGSNGKCSHLYALVSNNKNEVRRGNVGLDILVPIGNSDHAALVDCVTTFTALFTMTIILYAMMKM